MSENIILNNAPIIKFKTPKTEQKQEHVIDTKPVVKNEAKDTTLDIPDVPDNLEKMVLDCIRKLEITLLKGIQGEPGIGREGKPGPRGADGAPGVPGKPGKNGISGADGKPGQNGLNGVDGKPGENGINGTDGRNGLDGAPGRDGAVGPEGPRGRDGPSGTSTKSSSSNLKTKSTIYVDQKFGNDDTAVSENAGLPYKTLAKAMKYATTNDCIIINPGSYGILSLRPNLWIESSHGLVLFDQILTPDNYKWKKNDAVYLSKISVRSHDKPALSIDRGNIYLNNCNISSSYGHSTNSNAVTCDFENCKVHVNGSSVNLESYGSNDLCTLIYAKGNETEVLMDNNAFEIKRIGSDALIYTLYNSVKMGNIRISRSDVVIDADDSNKVQMEYVSEDAGVNSEIRGTTYNERSSNPSYKSTKSEVKPWKPNADLNTNTRIIKEDATLTPNDNFIIITSEQKCNITLPTLTAPKLKELSGNIQSIVYIIKSTKEFVNHTILAGENNRINEFDKSITLDNSKTLHLRSVGSDWIIY
jgi:hypothetical protein